MKKIKRMKRKKILPDRVFHKLWSGAEKAKDKQEFVRQYTSILSAQYIDFKKKYHLTFEETLYLLNEVYEKQHMSFKEILLAAGKRKADIANVFCIPIRTVEEWYTGNNKCNSYIRLMLLRQYHLLKLGKYIYVESEVEHKENTPDVYKKHNVSKVRVEKVSYNPSLKQKKSNKKNGMLQKPWNMDYELYEEEDEDELWKKIDDIKVTDIDEIVKNYENKCNGTPNHYEVKSLLERTAYLDKIMKPHN